MSAIKQQKDQTKITEQTFIDLGMWLTHPEQHSAQQLTSLLDEDARLPLIALTNTYWLGGALHNSLKKSTIWQQLDPELTAYLAELEQFLDQRNQTIKQEAIFACQLLTDAQIPVIMLKGSASLFNGVFNPISNRFMTDIDLLVPEELQQQANETLVSHGYLPQLEEHEQTPIGHHHAPALFREGGECCVELHRWVLKKSVSDVLSTTEVWQQATPLVLTSGLQILQLEPSQQVILSIAHSELSHSGFSDKQLDWRQLINLHALVKYHQENINWQTVQNHFGRCISETPKMALSSLLVAADKLLKLSTPITNPDDTKAKIQVNSCISKYVKRQNPNKRFAHLFAVISRYGDAGIKEHYGDAGRYPLLTGRLKHIKKHINMAVQPKQLSKFIKRVFK
ncbi:nucleotidyltransferase family protein [Thalassotalea sp. ND16A]|uniref:nucleotidyltransferase family protein n=1 Tax=Thalassotalea sp. ND16A TaxID=1535422 RepID=UPI000519EE44|nr:nucleotidyltransferase family protein [Thalassotalea sp. ND16A]KGJ94216.1 hypothetical protein ND16A_1422 [Thalassotalea sp. ND16A]